MPTKVSGWVERGNIAVEVSGQIRTVPLIQGSYPLSTVSVFNSGTLALSTIYSDYASTPKSNPFTAGSDSSWGFYANAGQYDIRFSGGSPALPYAFALGDVCIPACILCESILEISGTATFTGNGVDIFPTFTTETVDRASMFDAANPTRAGINGNQYIVFNTAGIYLIYIDHTWNVASPDSRGDFILKFLLIDPTDTKFGTAINARAGVEFGSTWVNQHALVVGVQANTAMYFNLHRAETDNPSSRTVSYSLKAFPYIGGTVGLQAPTPACRACSLNNLTIANDGPHVLPLDTNPASAVDFPGELIEGNPTAMHAYNGANPSRITFNTAGVYLVGMHIITNVVATKKAGTYTAKILKNGATVILTVSHVVTTPTQGAGTWPIGEQDFNDFISYNFSAGDYIELQVEATGAATGGTSWQGSSDFGEPATSVLWAAFDLCSS